MAELHTNLYIKHHDERLHEKLAKVFTTINDSPQSDSQSTEDDLVSKALDISPGIGKELVDKLISSVEESYGTPSEDLEGESRSQIAGYESIHFVHGSSGTDVIISIIKFLAELAPGVDVRACLVGDDDPWEIFYRYENGKVISQYYEPDYGEADEDELPEVYQWWHAGLPPEIKDGFINEWKEEDDNDDDDEY